MRPSLMFTLAALVPKLVMPAKVKRKLVTLAHA